MPLAVAYQNRTRESRSSWDLVRYLQADAALALPDDLAAEFDTWIARFQTPSILTSPIKQDAFALHYLGWLARHRVIELSCDALFVYGTLTPGNNNSVLLGPAVAETYDERFTVPGRLYVNHGYPVADLSDVTSTSNLGDLVVHRISGNLIALRPEQAAELLAKLDAFELPVSLRRTLVYVQSPFGERHPAWIYAANDPAALRGAERIESGDWRSYERPEHPPV